MFSRAVDGASQPSLQDNLCMLVSDQGGREEELEGA